MGTDLSKTRPWNALVSGAFLSGFSGFLNSSSQVAPYRTSLKSRKLFLGNFDGNIVNVCQKFV